MTFGKFAYQLGAERLRATAERFGLNENLKFGDLAIYNSAFLVCAQRRRAVWAGVGQGEARDADGMAMIAGSVANGGMMMAVLVKRIENSLGIATHRRAVFVPAGDERVRRGRDHPVDVPGRPLRNREQGGDPRARLRKDRLGGTATTSPSRRTRGSRASSPTPSTRTRSRSSSNGAARAEPSPRRSRRRRSKRRLRL